MSNIMLLYVGAVLFLNGLWILGQIGDKEISVINVFVGGAGLVLILLIVLQGGNGNYLLAAQLLLFAFTYLWVAWNRYNGADGRGLGWFSLFVAVTAAPTALIVLSQANSVWLWWLGLSWVAWAVLWFMFFLLLALNKPIARITGWVTLLEGILTAWLPAFLLLNGWIS
ncbi:MAG: AmiS/UreI family transporter [Anaerolineae bacterium]